MMKSLAVVLLIAAVTTAVAGQDKKTSAGYLKKVNPDSLYYAVHIDDDCPGTERSYERIVQGELLRARIKPKQYWEMYDRFLDVLVGCAVRDDSEAYAYSLDVRFAQHRPILHPASDEYDFYVVHIGTKYGVFGFRGTGKDDEQHLQTLLRTAVTNALDDYLKANFTD